MSSVVKSVGKILLMVFIVLYFLMEIFVTVCLLNFNDYRVTVFGKNSLLLLDEDVTETYTKGDLVVVTKDDGSDVIEGDGIFFYNPGENYTVNYAIVTGIEEHNNKTYTFKIGNSVNVYNDYYIGKDTKVYNNVGGVLRFLESKWGFLLLIVLPTLIAVIYEVYVIIIEIIEIKKEVDNA